MKTLTPSKHQPEAEVHLICNAHLDPVWLWDWEEGLTEALSTFEVAADLLEQSDDFIFNHNESLLYEWILIHRPELFRRIQKWVHLGRWHIAGGWYLQPDCNIPLGESFVRQILIGRLFFKRHFGVKPRLAYNFDSFGHHGNMPQLLKKSGYDAYVHFRPGPADLKLPGNLYRWRGIDGSEVVSYRPPFPQYGTDHLKDLENRLHQGIDMSYQTSEPVGLFWGMGDHGGGATREDLILIKNIQKKHPHLSHSTTDSLMKKMMMWTNQMGVHEGGLQKCFPGCYTSGISIKQQNRLAEGMIQSAERWATLAWWKLGEKFPHEALTKIWKDVLFNQFHDILPGSGVRHALQGAAEAHGRAIRSAKEIILQSQLKLMRCKRKRPALSLLVFNPSAIPARIPVVFEYNVAHRPVMDRLLNACVTDLRGKKITTQEEIGNGTRGITTCGEFRKRLVFEAELPGLGIAEYRILQETKSSRNKVPTGVRIQHYQKWIQLTNRWICLKINRQTGWIDSLFDRIHQQEVLRQPAARLLVCKDNADAWGTDTQALRKVVGTFKTIPSRQIPNRLGFSHLKKITSVRIVENGPVRTLIETITAYQQSQAVIRYVVYAHRPEIEIQVKLQWNEPRHILKLSFPTIYDRDPYRVEIPYGEISLKQNQGEQTHQRWLVLEKKGPKPGAMGLACIGPAGHDVYRGDVRLSLVRSPIHSHAGHVKLSQDRFHDFMDLGHHEYTLQLCVGTAKQVRQTLCHAAEQMTMPPSVHVHIPLEASEQSGIPPQQSMVQMQGHGIAIGAFKVSENGNDLVVRLVEQEGKKSRAILKLHGNKPLAVQLHPFEIQTLIISRNGKFIRTCNLMEEND